MVLRIRIIFVPCQMPLEKRFIMVHLQSWRRDFNNGVHLSPTLEVFTNGPDDLYTFITEPPKDILARGDFLKVPMMMGKIASESGVTLNFCNQPG
jgi:hypothetical protein